MVALPDPDSEASRRYRDALLGFGVDVQLQAASAEEQEKAAEALEAMPAKLPRPLAFAGSAPGLGRSTAARALAALCAQTRAVALLDADSVRPSLRACLGASPPRTLGRFTLPWLAGNLRLAAIDAFFPESMRLPWRGSELTTVVGRFLQDVRWGSPDVFIVDLPSDVAAAQAAAQALADGDLIWFCTALDDAPPPELAHLTHRATVRLGAEGDFGWPLVHDFSSSSPFDAPSSCLGTIRSLWPFVS